nr:hypothetical protein [Tanacetum cinerariifolium]
MSAKDTIAVQRCGLSAKELNEFLSFYPIPLEYDVILPTSTQTIFDTPPGAIPGFSTGSPSALVNTELPRDVEEPKVQPAEITVDSGESLKSDVFIMHPASVDARIKERKCKTRGGSSSPPVKRKLASGSSSSHVVRAKTSASKDDELPRDVEEPKVQPAEITVDSGESLKSDVFIMHPASVDARIKERKCKTRGGSSRPPVKRKLASGSSSSHVVRAKTSASKDDAPILSISDDDECKFPVHLVLSKVNKRAREFLQVIEKMRGEADVIKARERSREEECDDLRVKCEAVMAEFDKNPDVLALREKISSLTTDVKEHKDAAASIEALLSKKPPTLQKHAPSRTQIPVPSSHKATPSFALSSNPMSPPADLLKPFPSLFK